MNLMYSQEKYDSILPHKNEPANLMPEEPTTYQQI